MEMVMLLPSARKVCVIVCSHFLIFFLGKVAQLQFSNCLATFKLTTKT
jgi:hypothetical protein